MVEYELHLPRQITLLLPRWRYLLSLAVIVLAIWLPRGLALGRFVTPDEPSWLNRSANFYYALTHRDFASTYQREHPGVTIMWAGTAGFLWRYPEYKDSQAGQLSRDEFHNYIESRPKEVTPLELLRAGRVLAVLANTVVLAACFLYARRLAGLWPALLAFMLVAFDPFHLALTRLLHLDGLISNLVLLSLLAYCSFLHGRQQTDPIRKRKENIRDLILSAAAAGLGWLTKSPALFVVPVVGLLTLGETWRSYARRSDRGILAHTWEQVWPALAWFAIGALVFIALWPAMWVQPFQTLAHVIGEAQTYAGEGHNSALFFNGQVINDGNLGLPFFYFYPLTYLWRSTPVVLLGLPLALWGFFTRREPFDGAGARLMTVALALTVIVFLAGLTLPLKKFDRYFLPAYAPLDIIAGLGWFSLLAFLKQKELEGILRYSPSMLAAAVIGTQMALSLSTFPYYFTYYNPLMGGSRKAPDVMQIGWGEGLDEAARYLNQKPDAQKLKVMAWYPTGCFSYIFEGKERNFWLWTGINEDEWNRFFESDYAVIYIGQQQRQLTKPILDYLAEQEPEHTVLLNGIEYARIYKVHQ